SWNRAFRPGPPSPLWPLYTTRTPTPIAVVAPQSPLDIVVSNNINHILSTGYSHKKHLHSPCDRTILCLIKQKHLYIVVLCRDSTDFPRCRPLVVLFAN